jgi:prepilin-type N-terminal cleavage/methylation domain-containing protein
MRPYRSSRRTLAFTLIELLTVMAVIAILASLILSISGYVTKKASSARADTEIKGISVACESYKTDNGSYPHQPLATSGTINWANAQLPYPSDLLDPRSNGNAQYNNAAYANASLELYEALSGDLSLSGTGGGPGVHNYIVDLRPDSLGRYYSSAPVSGTNPVTYLSDPFGNCYGYSTAANTYASTGTSYVQSSSSTTGPGFNAATFDFWSTAGQINNPFSGNGGGSSSPGAPGDPMLQWSKNW